MPYKPIVVSRADAYKYVCDECEIGQEGDYRTCPDWLVGRCAADECIKIHHAEAEKKDTYHSYRLDQIPSIKKAMEIKAGKLS